jgi:hypothetical protein
MRTDDPAGYCRGTLWSRSAPSRHLPFCNAIPVFGGKARVRRERRKRPRSRPGLASRFAGNATIRVLAPEDVARPAERRLDLIVLHSAVQDLKPQEAQALFLLFHGLLKPGGTADRRGDKPSPPRDALAEHRTVIDAGALMSHSIRASIPPSWRNDTPKHASHRGQKNHGFHRTPRAMLARLHIIPIPRLDHSSADVVHNMGGVAKSR